MLSGPVCCMVWVGKGAVKTGRKMLGETNPADSLPGETLSLGQLQHQRSLNFFFFSLFFSFLFLFTGTIRGDFAIEVGMNICHGSDSVEAAEKEIALWFPEGVLDYSKDADKWIYE